MSISNAAKKIAEMIPTLSTADLSYIEQAIRANRTLNANPDDTDMVWVVRCLADVLHQLGSEYNAPDMLLRMAPSTFKSKIPGLMIYLRKAHKTKVCQRAILMIGIELLYHDLTRANMGTSGVWMMNHIHRVPSMINKAFPGYAEFGLLGMIIQTELDHVREKRGNKSVSQRERLVDGQRLILHNSG